MCHDKTHGNMDRDTYIYVNTDKCIHRDVDVDRDIYVGEEKIEVDESECIQTRQSFDNKTSAR